MTIKFAPRLRMAAFVAVAGLSLSACASHKYVDEAVTGVNTRLQAVEARVNEVSTKADSAGQRADAAGAEAKTSTQRLDLLEGRVGELEKTPARRPRG